jgi:hypothetical protein
VFPKEIWDESYIYSCNKDDLDLLEFIYSETDYSTILKPAAYKLALEAELMVCHWLRSNGLQAHWLNGDYTRDLTVGKIDIDVKHRKWADRPLQNDTYWGLATQSFDNQKNAIKVFCAVRTIAPKESYSFNAVEMAGWMLPTDFTADMPIIKVGEQTPGKIAATYDMYAVYLAEMRSPQSLITYLEAQPC